MATSISISDDQIITRGTPIEVSFPGEVPRDLDVNQVLRLFRAGNITALKPILETNGSTIKVHTDELETGRHAIVVASPEGSQFSIEPIAVNFQVQNVNGKLPEGFSVLNSINVEIGEKRKPGKDTGNSPGVDPISVNFVKAVSRKDGTIAAFAFNKEGVLVDGPALLQENAKQRYNKYGCIQEQLHEKLLKTSSTAQVKVHVWPILPNNPSVASDIRAFNKTGVEQELNRVGFNPSSSNLAVPYVQVRRSRTGRLKGATMAVL